MNGDVGNEGEGAVAGCVRVLIVDDDTDSVETLAALLGLLGYELRTACDGLRALDTAQQFRPQCVMLDIDLPGLDGLDIARRLRRQPWGRDALLIATTGWNREEDRSAATVAGFDHFLPKPLNLDALIGLLPPAQQQGGAGSASRPSAVR